MQRFSSDVVGGALVAGFGVFVAVYASTLQVGTLRRMGPGFMPLTFGIVLVLAGAALAASAFASSGDRAEADRHGRLDLRAVLLIPASLIAFSILMRFGGLVPAAFAASFIGALADRGNTFRDAVQIGLAIVVVSVVVFWWLLAVQIPLFKGL